MGLALCPYTQTVLLVPKHLPLPELERLLCWEYEDTSPPQSDAYGVVAQVCVGLNPRTGGKERKCWFVLFRLHSPSSVRWELEEGLGHWLCCNTSSVGT